MLKLRLRGRLALAGVAMALSACSPLLPFRDTAESTPKLPTPAPAKRSASCGGTSLAVGARSVPVEPAAPRNAKGFVVDVPADEDEPGPTSIRYLDLQGSPRRVIAHGDVAAPTVSPDGKLVAFQEDDSGGLNPARVLVSDLEGGEPRLVFDWATSYVSTYPAWSPDGKRLALMSDGALWVVNADGNGRRVIRELEGDNSQWEAAAWSPDGKSIAYVDWIPDFELRLVGADGSGYRPLGEIESVFAWSPDGRYLAFANRGISVMEVSTSEIHHLAASAYDRGIYHLSWSPKGSQIVYFGEAVGLWTDADAVCLLSVDNVSIEPSRYCSWGEEGSWSPDGKSFAFVQWDGPECSDSQALVTIDVESKDLHRLIGSSGSIQWVTDG
jgi:Tol biopolymer transport system component